MMFLIFYSTGHLVTHKRTHTDTETPAAETAPEDDCGDFTKCEKDADRPERKHDIRYVFLYMFMK